MNVYLSFLHDFGILFLFDDDGLYQQYFRINLHANFIEHIDVSTRPTKCTDDGSIFGISILRVYSWCRIRALM